jgi:hypothetical protein
MINFGALLPTKPNQNTGFRSLGVPSNSFGEGTTLIEHQFVANEDIPKGQKSTIRLLAPSGSIYQTWHHQALFTKLPPPILNRLM